jgi:hypothetical protein
MDQKKGSEQKGEEKMGGGGDATRQKDDGSQGTSVTAEKKAKKVGEDDRLSDK